MNIKCLPVLLLTLLLSSSILPGQSKPDSPNALSYKMKSLSGKDVELSKYAGKVVLFVNVASKCGLTPQYKQLQELHAKYNAKGLEIVGVPCNQFGKQEPGSEKEIAEFCEENYGVEFDMLAKVNVNGDEQTPLYKQLTSLELKPVGKGPISWNFEKFLVNRTGEPIARFSPRTKPSDKSVITAIEQALAAGSSTASSTGGSHYSHQSSKSGKTYYLFSKDVALKNSDKVQTIYFFAKNPEHDTGTPLAEVPEGKMVSETKTGMLVLKKKK